jgi:hypothetical protein
MGTAVLEPGQIEGAPYIFTRSTDVYNGPDPYIVQEQLAMLQRAWVEYGPKEFMLRYCWIIRKNPEHGEKSILPSESEFWNRVLVPFYLNNIQSNIEENLGQKNIFLKPRQGGYTTYMIIRRLFLPCILDPGSNGLLISQNSHMSTEHFRILKRALRHFGQTNPSDRSKNWHAEDLHQHLLHTVQSNRKELVFDQLDLSIQCGSAEVEEVGQGLTLKHVVCTEVARWEGNPEATLANMKEAIPKDGTLDMESTANGHGGYFFEECMRARDVGKGYREFKYHFHEWWWHEEYFEAPGIRSEEYTKEEHRLALAHDLTPEQIAWRRKKKEDLRGDFDEKYPEDDMTCFLLTGGQFFDKEILRARYQELLTSQPREEHQKVIIYKKEKPHHEYIIGADVAEGVAADEEGNKLDWSAAYVIDKDSGETVAAYRDQIIPEEYGWDLAALGRRFNNALIAVERNGDGGAVILTLEVACMYGNLYKHRDWWKKDQRRAQRKGVSSAGQDQMKLREFLGWPTTMKTRPLALNRLRYLITEHPERLHDKGLIEECLTFVRNQDKRGRPEAERGCHDDRVLACSIALAVRQILRGYLDPDALPPREKYGAIPTEYQPDEPEIPVDPRDP